MGRIDQRAFHDGWGSLLVQNRYQCFSDSQFSDGFDDIEFWVGAKSLGRCLNTLLILGSESPEGMLYPISQLAQHGFRKVKRVLCDKVYAHTFRTDETDHLLDLLFQRLGNVVKQQMGFVKKEDQLGFLRVAHLRKLLKQFCKQPEQEGSVNSG